MLLKRVKADDLEKRFEIMKAEDIGFDYEDEGESEEVKEEDFSASSLDGDKIRVDQQMLSVKYMIELMDENLIELNPGYQRSYVWEDNQKKSLLIESLMLGIPIPAFYFYENENGQYQVIDGQQRLTTIKEFFHGEFRLSGLEYLGEKYNQKTFEELDPKYKQKIFRTQIAVNILDARSPKKIIYDIFKRINTGGMNLNPQEMRNAVAKPEVRKLLIQSTENVYYQLAIRNRVKDKRMASQELVLRFYAFYEKYDFEKEELSYNYAKIEDFLNDGIEKLNDMDNGKREALYEKFNQAMNRAYQAFGDFCFSKIRIDGVNSKRKFDFVNKSLFTSFSVLLMNPKYDDVQFEHYQNSLLFTLAKALEQQEYMNSITFGTGSKRNISINFEYSRNVLEECIR